MDSNSQGERTARILTPLGLGTALSLLGDSTLYTVLPNPPIAAEAGVTLAMVGVLLGANRLVRIFSNAAAGALYDRNQRRPLMVGSLALGALSTAIFASAHGFIPLLAARLLWGLAWSGIWIGGNTIVLDIAHDHNRGLLSGRYQMWFFIGAGAAAMLGGFFTDAFGFRGGLLFSSGLTALGVLIWALWLPETRPQPQPCETQFDASQPLRFPWRTSLAVSVPIFIIRFIFAGVIVSTTILWLTQFTGQGMRLGAWMIPIATLTGSFVALRAALSVLGAPVAGWFSDRIQDRWIVMAMSFAVGALGLWFMGLPSPAPALLGAVLASLTAGAVQALAPALAGDRIRAIQRGRGIAIMFTLGDLGSALGPVTALGLLSWIPLGSVYRLASGVLVASTIFSLVGRRTEGPPET